MAFPRLFAICLLLSLAAAQINYPNTNNNNNPDYNNYNTRNYDNNNPNYDNNNPNYDNNNPNNPNYNNPNNPNYNSNYNPNNPSNSNYNPNNPSNSNYNPNNPNTSNYNSNNPSSSNYNPNNPNYNSNNPTYNPNNPSYNQNNPNYSSNQNNPSYNNNNNNNNNNNQNYNPSFNQAPLDQGDCCEDYCYRQDPEPYLHFGTKTAYDSITRRSGNQHLIPDCTPVQFWSIVRHGTRLPDANTIRAMRNMNRIHDEIARNYEQRRSFPDRGRLCPQDYDLFRRWRFNESVTEGNANTLSKQGIDDMKLLARRYKAKYPDILQNYDERSYNFQYSIEDRTHDSFQAYIEGLFDQDAFRVHANTGNSNRLTTSPVRNCPRRYQENQNNQFFRKSEEDRFKEKSDYQKMVRDVFRRLGFRFSLNATVIEDMYNLCAYEKAWNPQPRSPWCIAFNKPQLKLMEYIEDLKYYYESGYGNQMAEKLGCSTVKDMYQRFESTVNGNSDGNKATFIFAETPNFISTLVSLGINKDFDRLTADNYLQQTRRSWRTSTMSPFAANLVASLYQCNRGEKYRVMFFLNELPVEFPDCSVGLCNWSTIQQKYQDLVMSCNAEDICNERGSAAKHFATVAVLFLTSIIAITL